MINTPDELRTIIAVGETEVTEFKTSMSLTKEALQSLCGMLNSEAAKGTILFGVAPDATVCGIEPGNTDKAQQSLAQRISSKFEPHISPIIALVECTGRKIIILEARRDGRTPYHEYDGRAFIREGTVTRRLSLSEKDALARRRNRGHHNGPWKCDKCGSMVGMLVGYVVSQQGMVKSYACDCGGEFWPAA